jgi:hypothetical protein
MIFLYARRNTFIGSTEFLVFPTTTGRRLQPPSISGSNLKEATTPLFLQHQLEGGYNPLSLPCPAALKYKRRPNCHYHKLCQLCHCKTCHLNLINCWLLLFLSTAWADTGLDLNKLPIKPSKTIDPLGKPEGNIAHRMYCVVSPEIVLWVNELLKLL